MKNYSVSSIESRPEFRQGLTFLARIIVRQVLEKQNQEAAKLPQIEIEKGMEENHAAVFNE